MVATKKKVEECKFLKHTTAEKLDIEHSRHRIEDIEINLISRETDDQKQYNS